MSERDDREMTDSMLQRAMGSRFSRRSVLKGAGMGAAGFSLAAFMAACGSNGGGGEGGANPTEVFGGEAGDTVEFANWPLYLDQAKDKDGNVFHPTLKLFKEETGIDVNYSAVIDSNAEFFGKLRPELLAGTQDDWDIIVISSGREFNVLTANEYVYQLDASKRPNFDANATSFANSPTYDKGNKYSMTWQGGFTSVAYDTTKVNGEITKLDDLANPDKVGTNSVGMFTMGEGTPDLVMVNLGIDPVTSGPDEWKEAAAWLQMQKDSGTVRAYYAQGYIEDFVAGNTKATMAWSGDVLYYKLWLGYSDLEFIFLEGGAVLFQDNMLVPIGAPNAPGAAQVMDWYYDPKIATMVTEWVLYLSPVNGVQERIVKDADQAVEDGYKGYAAKLYATADNEYAFPSEDLLNQAPSGTPITTDEAAEEWDNIFLPIQQG